MKIIIKNLEIDISIEELRALQNESSQDKKNKEEYKENETKINKLEQEIKEEIKEEIKKIGF